MLCQYGRLILKPKVSTSKIPKSKPISISVDKQKLVQVWKPTGKIDIQKQNVFQSEVSEVKEESNDQPNLSIAHKLVYNLTTWIW